jgi:hypothetical protein
MDLHTIKFGLGIATAVISGMIVLFALYVQMGASRQKEKVVLHHKEKQK